MVSRNHSLDALRAFALLLGIVFHAAESFCPDRQSWAITDRNAHMVFDLFQYVCHSFRMEIFFLIAGLFAHMLIRREGWAGFVRDRARRIALPLVAGWVILYPLVMLIWIWGKSVSGSLATLGIPQDLHQLSPFSLTVGVITQGAIFGDAFSLGHLWFLYYLVLLYVVALAVRWAALQTGFGRRLPARLDLGFATVFTPRWRLVCLAMATLPFTTLMRGGVDTPNGSLIPNVPVLAVYGIFFGAGWMIHRQPGLLDSLSRGWGRHLALGAALALVSYFPRTILGAVDPTGGLLAWAPLIHGTAYPFMMWALVLGVTGSFIALRRTESPRWRYVADSSYWLYLCHLLVVVPLQILAAGIDANAFLKLFVINAVAFPVLIVSYHYLVRPTFVGAILNGRRRPRRLPSRTSMLTASATAATRGV